MGSNLTPPTYPGYPPYYGYPGYPSYPPTPYPSYPQQAAFGSTPEVGGASQILHQPTVNVQNHQFPQFQAAKAANPSVNGNMDR